VLAELLLDEIKSVYTFLVSVLRPRVPIVNEPPLPNLTADTLACVLLSEPFIKFCEDDKNVSVLFATRPIAVLFAPIIVHVL